MMRSTSRTSKGQRTQWTAQFLAAAELVRHGYVVSFTMGNSTPIADLMAARQDGTFPFWVDVKGLGSNSAWFIRRREQIITKLFYILVRVGETRTDDIFFILNHSQANELIAQQTRIDEEKGHRDVGGGFLWGAPAPYRDQWNLLPGWLSEQFIQIPRTPALDARIKSGQDDRGSLNRRIV